MTIYPNDVASSHVPTTVSLDMLNVLTSGNEVTLSTISLTSVFRDLVDTLLLGNWSKFRQEDVPHLIDKVLQVKRFCLLSSMSHGHTELLTDVVPYLDSNLTTLYLINDRANGEDLEKRMQLYHSLQESQTPLLAALAALGPYLATAAQKEKGRDNQPNNEVSRVPNQQEEERRTPLVHEQVETRELGSLVEGQRESHNRRRRPRTSTSFTFTQERLETLKRVYTATYASPKERSVALTALAAQWQCERHVIIHKASVSGFAKMAKDMRKETSVVGEESSHTAEAHEDTDAGERLPDLHSRYDERRSTSDGAHIKENLLVVKQSP